MRFKFNMSKQYNLIRDLYEEENFKDRSELLEYLNYLMDTNNRYVCVNSRICNGKTAMASLVTSFYSKDVDSRDLFDELYSVLSVVEQLKLDQKIGL